MWLGFSRSVIGSKVFETNSDRTLYYESFDVAFKTRKSPYIILQTDAFCSSEFENAMNRIRFDVFQSDPKVLGYTITSYL